MGQQTVFKNIMCCYAWTLFTVGFSFFIIQDHLIYIKVPFPYFLILYLYLSCGNFTVVVSYGFTSPFGTFVYITIELELSFVDIHALKI